MTILPAALSLTGAAGSQIVGAVPAGTDREQTSGATGLAAGPSVTLRGRLFAANGGGSGYRIWPVGTKRILWVSWRVDPPVPDAVMDAFKPFDEALYGDFTLLPLSADRPGVMREVCFVAGRQLVIEDVKTGLRRRLAP